MTTLLLSLKRLYYSLRSERGGPVSAAPTLHSGIGENLTHKPASQAPGPFGLRGNRREKLAQNLLRGDERRSGQVHGHGGAGPRIARQEDRDPIERVRKNLFHFFGVPYT